LSLLLDSSFGFDDVLLGLRVEVSEGNCGDNYKEKSNRDHKNNHRCGSIIFCLDLDDFWFDIIFDNLRDRNVLVDGFLFNYGSDVWSENALLSGDSINVFDSCIGGSFGDYDWRITIGRYSAV
jgi:hypothetical protein